jgi:pilus assembly protein CpaE
VKPHTLTHPARQHVDSLSVDALSIAVIDPQDEPRKAALTALTQCSVASIRELAGFLPSMDDVPELLEQLHDVIIIGLDSNPEYALEMVENICAHDRATVMVYSAQSNPDLLVLCMRAGAREFLTLPFDSAVMAEALVRAAARRPALRTVKRARGRLLGFMGAKGGAGVTMLACNFAVALAQESKESTVLIDLDLPLGDAALNLGIVAEFSTIDALQDYTRLDASFLSKLLVKDKSGISVLAAPGKFPLYQPTNEAIDKLLTVARQEFDNVVVDLGSRLDLTGTTLFRDASAIYLVTQTGISELRNSNRLITQVFANGGSKLEIVINRYDPKGLGVSEEHVTRALTRPAQWKIPNDYLSVRQMQIDASPLVLMDSPMSRLIRTMARTVAGHPAATPKKKGFSFFR